MITRLQKTNRGKFTGMKIDVGQAHAFAWIGDNGVQSELTFAQWQNYTMGTKPDAHGLATTPSTIDDYWTDSANHIYTITSSLSSLSNAGIYLSSPTEVLIDLMIFSG